VHISVNVVLTVKVLDSNQDLAEDVENFEGRELAFAERLPLGDHLGGLHLDKDEVIGHNPIVEDFNKVLMFQSRQELDEHQCFASLLAVQGRDVHAGDHAVLLLAVSFIVCDENFAIALLEVERIDHVGVVAAVRRLPKILLLEANPTVLAVVTVMIAVVEGGVV